MTSKPLHLHICVLTTHERNGWINKTLATWLLDLRWSGVIYDVIFFHNFMPAASARNHYGKVVKTLEPKPDWVMMVDNDIGPHEDLLDCLKGAPEDASVIVPEMGMWDEGKGSVILCWGMDEKIAPKENGRQFFTVVPGNFYPLTKCGTGAIFIKPDVFDKLSMPYFWYNYNEEQGMEGTEDINFAHKCIDAGLKIYGRAGVRVSHWHNVNLEVLAVSLGKLEERSNMVAGVPVRPTEVPVA